MGEVMADGEVGSSQMMAPVNVEKKTIPEDIKKRFTDALTAAIKTQMKYYPTRFSKVVLDDSTYPDQFAQHMVSKFESQSVVVINETVVEACFQLDIGQTIMGVYKFLQLDPPGGAADLNRPVPVKFKGC